MWKPKKSVQKPKRIDQKVSLSSPKRSSLDAVQKILFSKWHPKGRKYFFSHDKQKNQFSQRGNGLSQAMSNWRTSNGGVDLTRIRQKMAEYRDDSRALEARIKGTELVSGNSWTYVMVRAITISNKATDTTASCICRVI